MKPDREGREKNKIKRKMASALQRKKKKKGGTPPGGEGSDKGDCGGMTRFSPQAGDAAAPRLELRPALFPRR